MSRQIRGILGYILWLLLLLAASTLFMRFVMQRTDVSGNSMQPTLENRDSLLVDKISYRFKDPERFDIVVFPFEYPTAEADETYFIKRIIGLPGETVQITEDGRIWINGEQLAEHYGLEVIKSPGRAAEPLTLGADEYFVVGDNRNNSMDSRDPAVGNISRKKLIGKAFVRILPFSRFGVLQHQ